MTDFSNLNIWLSYVSLPITTAVYFENSFRRIANTITVGPKVNNEILTNWNLLEVSSNLKNLDLDFGWQPDFNLIAPHLNNTNKPDLFIWIESVGGHSPQNLKALNVPTACYLIDSHVNLTEHLNIAKNFDFVFIAQLEYVKDFTAAGIQNVYWLPLGADKMLHRNYDKSKKYNVGFVGSINSQFHSRRQELLNKINSEIPVSYKRCFLDDMVNHLAESKIVFNNAIKNDLNMRVFETLSIGSLLLTDKTFGNGQEIMFKNNEDLVEYDDDEIVEKAKYYIQNDSERERISKKGNEICLNAHTYDHRAEELLNVLTGKKKETKSPEEWRHLSERKTTVFINEKDEKKIKMKNNTRSFVIPVLDYSPASQYNIKTLLDDLNNIEGEVIVVFNSLAVAQEIADNPRIDQFAIMKNNVGVSRAWNIGLNISRTPTTFIINSDVKITKDAVDKLEEYLNTLPEAAIVGPQGSFFNFEDLKDIKYYDKGSFEEVIQVDAVSGFFFAVKTELFNSNVLHFDNQYTPCYFEEWEIGLQCKLAGLAAYIVPITDYDHTWSGSIRSYEKIKFYDEEKTPQEIHSENKVKFLKKWRGIQYTIDDPEFLVSYWVDAMMQEADSILENGKQDEVIEYYKEILQNYPANLRSLEKLGNLQLNNNLLEDALETYGKISEIEPEYVIDSNKLTNSF